LASVYNVPGKNFIKVNIKIITSASFFVSHYFLVYNDHSGKPFPWVSHLWHLCRKTTFLTDTAISTASYSVAFHKNVCVKILT